MAAVLIVKKYGKYERISAISRIIGPYDFLPDLVISTSVLVPIIHPAIQRREWGGCCGQSLHGRVAYFGVTQKIQHFPQLISQWISLWNEGEIVRVTELYLLVSESFDDPNDNGGKNDDGDGERDELGDAKQIKEGPNDQNNT
ncbi:hypothetical protein C8J56DRAFT_1027205 [Mycena floridula]|nr:hypothetical protein C8J56DRAFT_1027205 [Mycena floridula]